MIDEKAVLRELVGMSLVLGSPENDYVILGEGNTSALVDEDRFFVKASGAYLADANEDSFVQVKLQDALAIMDAGDLTDDQIKDALLAACADPANRRRPSVETTFHAFLLTLPNIRFVGHTHPTAVNSLLCSVKAAEVLKGRIFPDEIVYCGVEPIFIEYVDPGVHLSVTIRERARAYMDSQGCVPKVILVQNHGLIACGATAHEVEAITAMCCKTFRVLAGAMTFGGIHYFTRENVERIFTRPDEHYRQQQFRKS